MAITFIFFLTLSRFFYVQVVWADKLQYLAIDQWTREIPVIARRGLITDRNGAVLAENSETYSVFARPNAIDEIEHTAQALADILSLDGDKLLSKLKSKRVSEITVSVQTEKSAITKLSELQLKGVYYSRDNKRYYPYGDLLCQALGYAQSDGNGQSGLEKYYNKYLFGRKGEILFETDLVGVELENSIGWYISASDGYTLKTTFDYGIQALVEQTVHDVYEQHSPKNVRCIVISPQNGEVLAMANYPSYSLNEVPRDNLDKLNSQSRNGIVCDIYEPGSTFKIITAAANIEEYVRGNKSAFSPQYVFNSTRTREVEGTKIKCWSNHQNGKHCNQTLSDALNNSCNPCFTDIALSLGKQTFYDYLELFNFGRVTGIDVEGEALGMLLSESYAKNCDLARIGFGQTVAVTPLQLICASASAVNGGYYYKPSLVKELYTRDNSIKIKNELVSRTVSEKTSDILNAMLEGVVSEGSAKKAYVEGYKVAGKTGTAQKYENGRIANGKYVSSFLGYFPSNEPKYMLLITVDEPQGAYYGSVVAAPYAGEIFKGIINLKNIKPYE